jgi:hypothetical protein
VSEPVYFSSTVENETIEATEKLLAVMRQKLGREPTVTELKRWIRVYRRIADRLEVLALLQARTSAPARRRSGQAPTPKRSAIPIPDPPTGRRAKRGAVREEA